MFILNFALKLKLIVLLRIRMKLKSTNSHQKKGLFWTFSICTIASVILLLTIKTSNSTYNILPLIINIQHLEKPKRTPGTFAEDFTQNASKALLTFKGDSLFSFKYSKSEREGHAFSGCFFPLENIQIDFSKYDEIELEIKTKFARRIPFNLSVQNRRETHQYIRNFIEIETGKTNYILQIKEFYTPTSWYERNNIAQIEIPQQDLAKIEAISFESCQLLKNGVEDEFTISRLTLSKDLSVLFQATIFSTLFLELVYCILFLGIFRKKTEVVHIPIASVEYNKSEILVDRITAFMSENYTNPDLVLNDLSSEFGKGNSELSRILKQETKLSFPKYLSYLRIEEAKSILQKGDFNTVSEVGYIVGFNSPSNFIRVFKGEVGISPKKFVDQN
tara:strand:- start:2531 stop:3700 length:1170 start_codon:yes stop_codon:yes gene_type:complete